MYWYPSIQMSSRTRLSTKTTLSHLYLLGEYLYSVLRQIMLLAGGSCFATEVTKFLLSRFLPPERRPTCMYVAKQKRIGV